jgi:hypothetical protein
MRKKYHPAKIRTDLDDRDGFVKKKRKQSYNALSTLGTHPSPGGFELKRDGGRFIHSGPLRQRVTLERCIQEATRTALPLGAMLQDYCNAEVRNGKSMSSRLALILQRTRLKYLNVKSEA